MCLRDRYIIQLENNGPVLHVFFTLISLACISDNSSCTSYLLLVMPAIVDRSEEEERMCFTTKSLYVVTKKRTVFVRIRTVYVVN